MVGNPSGRHSTIVANVTEQYKCQRYLVRRSRRTQAPAYTGFRDDAPDRTSLRGWAAARRRRVQALLLYLFVCVGLCVNGETCSVATHTAMLLTERCATPAASAEWSSAARTARSPTAQVDVLVGVFVQLGAAGVRRVQFTSQKNSDRQAFAEVLGVSGVNIRMAEPRTKAREPTRGAPAATILRHRVDEPPAAGVNAAAQRLPTRTAAASRLSRPRRSPHGWCSSTSSRP